MVKNYWNILSSIVVGAGRPTQRRVAVQYRGHLPRDWGAFQRNTTGKGCQFSHILQRAPPHKLAFNRKQTHNGNFQINLIHLKLYHTLIFFLWWANRSNKWHCMVVGREMGVQMHVGFCLASISAAGEAGCWCPLWPLRLVVKDSLNPLWRV